MVMAESCSFVMLVTRARATSTKYCTTYTPTPWLHPEAATATEPPCSAGWLAGRPHILESRLNGVMQRRAAEEVGGVDGHVTLLHQELDHLQLGVLNHSGAE